MVKCPRCGYENQPSSKYCDNCDYLLSDTDGNTIKNAKRKRGWKIGLGKKIIIVIGIIVIAYLLFSFVYQSSQPSHQDSLNVITDDGSHYQSASYPYKAVVKYDGDWYAKMGDPNYLVEESGQGTKTYTLDCAAWESIAIEAQKQDYGEGNLTIQLLKNDEVVAEQSTTNTTGNVVINYNY